MKDNDPLSIKNCKIDNEQFLVLENIYDPDYYYVVDVKNKNLNIEFYNDTRGHLVYITVVSGNSKYYIHRKIKRSWFDENIQKTQGGRSRRVHL